MTRLEQQRVDLDELATSLYPWQRAYILAALPLVEAAFADFNRAMVDVIRAVSASPGIRAFGAFMRRLEIAEARAALVRPDGRPRRSGHRHRGTRAWRRRHG